jgi:adenylate cyclase
VGIGVNSGPVVAGTVGGGGRVEFTVIGDAVNTAARVEAATRQTGDDVLITDATRTLLPDGRFSFEERPPMPLKGKRADVGLCALVEEAAPAGVADGERLPEEAGSPAALTFSETLSVRRDQTGQDQPV